MTEATSGHGTKLPIWNVCTSVAIRGKSGHHLLVLSFTGFDPKQSFAGAKYYAAASP
jgi:hypothetical protein